MTDRPAYLIIVTHAGQAGLELFSAHHTEQEARVMLTRMERLLAPAGSRTHLIEVPTCEGVADVGELPPLPVAPRNAAAPASLAQIEPQAEKPPPFRRRTQAEFLAETEAMMTGDDGIVRDTPMPAYAGAMS